MIQTPAFLKRRSDYSQFLVHLTRDTEDGWSASENLRSIIQQRQIHACNHYCMVSPLIRRRRLGDLAEAYCVTCFTETPLDQIHQLTENLPGRSIRLRPYGLVFEKHTVIEAGGNPAIYLNTYTDRQILAHFRGAFDAAQGDPDEDVHNIVPFTNIMRQDFDFHWEREWRIRGDFKFKLRDIVAIIAPSKDEVQYVRSIPVINPELTYESIVLELSVQQRRLYRLLRDA